jgi:hypothetical protein
MNFEFSSDGLNGENREDNCSNCSINESVMHLKALSDWFLINFKIGRMTFRFQKYLSVTASITFDNFSMISKDFTISHITSAVLPNPFNVAFKPFYMEEKICKIHHSVNPHIVI